MLTMQIPTQRKDSAGGGAMDMGTALGKNKKNPFSNDSLLYPLVRKCSMPPEKVHSSLPTPGLVQ